MSTLVLLIPYSEGIVLVADRQVTYDHDHSRNLQDKIYYFEKVDTVIGFSGDRSGASLLAQEIEKLDKGVDFESWYQEARDNLRNRHLEHRMDVEALSIAKKNGNLECYSVNAEDPPISISKEKPRAIGEGELYIRPHLDKICNFISHERAVEFGKVMIEYSSRIALTVGSPTQFGVSVATVPLNGKIVRQNLERDAVPIEYVLYDFGR